MRYRTQNLVIIDAEHILWQTISEANNLPIAEHLLYNAIKQNPQNIIRVFDTLETEAVLLYFEGIIWIPKGAI